jgi:DNA-binding NarL/FixJ family response regulator
METGAANRRFEAMAVHLPVTAACSGSEDPVREPSPIRVILADEHRACRRNLRLLLDCEAGVEVIAEAPDISAVLAHASARPPHVLAFDPSIQNGSRTGTIRRLRLELPETGIVVLTMDESTVFADRALAAGAIGFVLKHKADEELPAAVRTAARGEAYVSPRVAPRLGSQLV